MSKDKLTIGAILFPEYDLLDVNGPLRMFGALENVNILMISQHGDKIKSGSKIGNYTEYNFGNCPEFDILFVPGTRLCFFIYYLIYHLLINLSN